MSKNCGKGLLSIPRKYRKVASSRSVTPPILEIIWVKNVRAIVVCGFLMK